MQRSQFNLFYDIGVQFFGRSSGQALNYAIYFVERRQAPCPALIPVNRQRYFGFNIRG
jgi:hypothetical protein